MRSDTPTPSLGHLGPLRPDPPRGASFGQKMLLVKEAQEDPGFAGKETTPQS